MRLKFCTACEEAPFSRLSITETRTARRPRCRSVKPISARGVLTTFYYGGIGYSGGLVVGLKALIAAIVGGIGSIHGALIGAVLVGLAETVWSGLFPIEYRDPALFVALVLVLWLKPSGLYGYDQFPNGPRL